MRKRFRVLLLAAIVAAAAVPFGFALSVQSVQSTTRSSSGLIATTSVANTAGALVRPGDSSSESFLRPMPDSAALLAVGAVLFGLAAAVRKANLS
jgi:hypothetical protein